MKFLDSVMSRIRMDESDDYDVRGLNARAISEWIINARNHEFEGFGGWCGCAAVAINQVIFRGRGIYVGAANRFFLRHGRFVGHVAVKFRGKLWDADGRPKTIDEIESWAMLDEHDPDYIEAAEKLGSEWNESLAYDIELVQFDNEKEILRYFPYSRKSLPEFVQALEHARPVGVPRAIR